MSKFILKTEKRPTKVSDHLISKAVDKAYALKDPASLKSGKNLAPNSLSKVFKKK